MPSFHVAQTPTLPIPQQQPPGTVDAVEIRKKIMIEQNNLFIGEKQPVTQEGHLNRNTLLYDSHHINVFQREGITVDQLIRSTSQNLIDAEANMPDYSNYDENDHTAKVKQRCKNPEAVKLSQAMSILKSPQRQPLSNLKTQDSPKKENKVVRLKEIVEVMHEDAETMMVELAEEPKIKGPRKNKKKKRYDEHKASKMYKINKQNEEFVEQLDTGSEGEQKNSKTAQVVDSIGSSVSLGGLLESDLESLMNQEIAEKIRQRRILRRLAIERSRLAVTAQSSVIQTVRHAPSLVSPSRNEIRCTPLQKLEQLHSKIGMPNTKPLDTPDQKSLVADLKSMRNNLKNVFATDFSNVELPPGEPVLGIPGSIERKRTQESEAKYSTQQIDRQRRKFRNEVLTPLAETHMIEEDTLNQELLTEIELQVGTIILEQEYDVTSFSKTLAGTLYSQGSRQSLDETQVTSHEGGKLTTQPSEVSVAHESKPSFIMENSQIKQHLEIYNRRMAYFQKKTAQTSPAFSNNTEQHNRIICAMEKLKKTHSSNLNTPLIEQLKMILERIACFNGKSGPESNIGLTHASRKYLHMMDSEDEDQPMMEKVSRQMMKINASQKTLDRSIKKMKRDKPLPDNQYETGGQTFELAGSQSVSLIEQSKRKRYRSELKDQATQVLKQLSRQVPRQPPHARLQDKGLHIHGSPVLSQNKSVQQLQPIDPSSSNQVQLSRVSVAIDQPRTAHLMLIQSENLSPVSTRNSPSQDSPLNKDVAPVVNERGNMPMSQQTLLSQQTPLAMAPIPVPTPLQKHPSQNKIIEGSAEQNRDTYQLLMIQGRASPVSPGSPMMKLNGSPLMSPVFRSSVVSPVTAMEQKQKKVSPQETMEFYLQQENVDQHIDKSIGAQNSLWHGFGENSQQSVHDQSFQLANGTLLQFDKDGAGCIQMQHISADELPLNGSLSPSSDRLKSKSGPSDKSHQNKYDLTKQKIHATQQHIQNQRVVQKGVQNLQLVSDEQGLLTDTQLTSNSRLGRQMPHPASLQAQAYAMQPGPGSHRQKLNEKNKQNTSQGSVYQIQIAQQQPTAAMPEWQRKIHEDFHLLSQRVNAEEQKNQNERQGVQVMGVPFTGMTHHEVIDETQEGTDHRSQNLGNTHQRMMLKPSNLSVTGNELMHGHNDHINVVTKINVKGDMGKPPQTSWEVEQKNIVHPLRQEISPQYLLEAGKATTYENKLMYDPNVTGSSVEKYKPNEPQFLIKIPQIYNESPSNSPQQNHPIIEVTKNEMLRKPTEAINSTLYAKGRTPRNQVYHIQHLDYQNQLNELSQMKGAQQNSNRLTVVLPILKSPSPSNRDTQAQKNLQLKQKMMTSWQNIEKSDQEIDHINGKKSPMSNIMNNSRFVDKSEAGSPALTVVSRKKKIEAREQPKMGDGLMANQDMYSSRNQYPTQQSKYQAAQESSASENRASSLKMNQKFVPNLEAANINASVEMIKIYQQLNSPGIGPFINRQQASAETLESHGQAYYKILSRGNTEGAIPLPPKDISDLNLPEFTSVLSMSNLQEQCDYPVTQPGKGILKKVEKVRVKKSPSKQNVPAFQGQEEPQNGAVRYISGSRLNDTGNSSMFKQKRQSEHTYATKIYRQAKVEMMEDLMFTSASKLHSPLPTNSTSIFVVSPTMSPRQVASPDNRRQNSILRAARARRHSLQQCNNIKYATIGNDSNLVAKKVDHNFTQKLRTNKRVSSIGAAGGFRLKRNDSMQRGERERMFDSFENMNQSPALAGIEQTNFSAEIVNTNFTHSNSPVRKPKDKRETAKKVLPKKRGIIEKVPLKQTQLMYEGMQELIKTEDMLDDSRIDDEQSSQYRSPSARKRIPLSIYDCRKQVVLSQQQHTEFLNSPRNTGMLVDPMDQINEQAGDTSRLPMSYLRGPSLTQVTSDDQKSLGSCERDTYLPPTVTSHHAGGGGGPIRTSRLKDYPRAEATQQTSVVNTSGETQNFLINSRKQKNEQIKDSHQTEQQLLMSQVNTAINNSPNASKVHSPLMRNKSRAQNSPSALSLQKKCDEIQKQKEVEQRLQSHLRGAQVRSQMASPSKLDNAQPVDTKNATGGSINMAHTTQKFEAIPTPDPCEQKSSIMEQTKELMMLSKMKSKMINESSIQDGTEKYIHVPSYEENKSLREQIGNDSSRELLTHERSHNSENWPQGSKMSVENAQKIITVDVAEKQREISKQRNEINQGHFSPRFNQDQVFGIIQHKLNSGSHVDRILESNNRKAGYTNRAQLRSKGDHHNFQFVNADSDVLSRVLGKRVPSISPKPTRQAEPEQPRERQMFGLGPEFMRLNESDEDTL